MIGLSARTNSRSPLTPIGSRRAPFLVDYLCSRNFAYARPLAKSASETLRPVSRRLCRPINTASEEDGKTPTQLRNTLNQTLQWESNRGNFAFERFQVGITGVRGYVRFNNGILPVQKTAAVSPGKLCIVIPERARTTG